MYCSCRSAPSKQRPSWSAKPMEYRERIIEKGAEEATVEDHREGRAEQRKKTDKYLNERELVGHLLESSSC